MRSENSALFTPLSRTDHWRGHGVYNKHAFNQVEQNWE